MFNVLDHKHLRISLTASGIMLMLICLKVSAGLPLEEFQLCD